MNIFIPAAGFGTRLLPITRSLPKPLLPIAGRPLLEILLEKLVQTNPKKIGINLHYQSQIFTEWLIKSAFFPQLHLFPEEPILGSGGALKNASQLLQQDHFIVYNADVVCDLNLANLLESHLVSGNIATLAICKQPKFNHVLRNVALDAKGFFQGVNDNLITKNNITQRVAFPGIAVYSPEFLQFLPPGKSSVLDAWLTAANSGYKIGTVDISSCYWNDIGTPQAYFAAVMDNLRKTDKSLFVHPSADVKPGVVLRGLVSIEADCRINSGVWLEDCIVLPGVTLQASERYQNCIIGPGFIV
jgi:NDP-sugar pyrophosphorylase family protein